MQQGSTFAVYRDHRGGRLYVGAWDAALNDSFLIINSTGLLINCSDRPTEKDYLCPSYWLNVNFVGADYRQEPAACLVDRAAQADNLIADTFYFLRIDSNCAGKAHLLGSSTHGGREKPLEA